MKNTPNQTDEWDAEQAVSLRVTVRDLDSDFIRKKLASDELTETARAIAIEELDRRQHHSQDEAIARITPTEIDEHHVSPTESTHGWGFLQWLILFVLCLSVVLAFGTETKNKIDQSFLYGVIFIQSLALTGVVRTFIAVFSSKGLSSIIVKIIAICMLCGILLSLSVCSLLAQHGWGGG